jgi:hypothetical protein
MCCTFAGELPPEEAPAQACHVIGTAEPSSRPPIQEGPGPPVGMTMRDWRGHSERTVAAALALALQVALYLLLMPPRLSETPATSSPALETMILNAVHPLQPLLAPPRASRLAPPRRVIQPIAVEPIGAPKVPVPAASPIDWRSGIQHEVGAELSRAYAPPKVRFGFPPMPAKKIPPPVFDGWNDARIHRNERLANGILDIGRCVIRLAFPIPLCQFGRTHAKGDLFKHMHQDRSAVGALP